MKYALPVILLLSFFNLQGQQFEDVYQKIEPSDSLPAELLSGKTVVLLDMDNSNKKELDRISLALHEQISKTGIDAVAYYSTSVFFSGIDITRSFIQDLNKRQAKSLIFLKYRGENSQIVVTQLDEDVFFTNENKTGWKRDGPFKELARSLYLEAANSGLNRANFLLNTIPENGPLTKPVKGNYSMFFNVNMKTNKLAVPKTGNLQRDFLLQNALEKNYPYEFEMVDNHLSEEELQKKGFNFILRYIEAEQYLVREFLGYPASTENSIISEYRTAESHRQIAVSRNSTVTKFYIKDLRKDDVYLGTEWDVATQWIDALINHIYSFREKTGI